MALFLANEDVQQLLTMGDYIDAVEKAYHELGMGRAWNNPRIHTYGQAQSGATHFLKVFTGTVPDYASSEKGLLLGGVIGGGPAELAGLLKGDVLIEIAGRTITNIYDYTYVLELLKIGEPVKVVYMRGGRRGETTMTPAARR